MRVSIFILLLAIYGCKTVPSEHISTISSHGKLSDRDVYIDTLKNYLGLKEETGNNDGYHIDKFNAICGFKNSPWCAAVLSYGLTVNGHSIPEQPCYSPSFFTHRRIVWVSGSKEALEKGDIFGLYFTRKGRIAHVGGVVEDFNDGWVLTIEGNTNDAGSREGNGMFTRLRHKSQIHAVSNWIDNE